MAAGMRPSTRSSCVADFAKKMSSSEFQPMIEMICMSDGMTQPLLPNCGLVAATESIPKRPQMGPAARNTSNMPIMQPPVSAAAPWKKFR